MIQDILRGKAGKLSADDISAITSILTYMIDNVESISSKVNRYVYIDSAGKSQGILMDWSRNVCDIQVKLANGNNTIQVASRELANEIADLNSAITTLQNEIRYYEKLVSTGAIMTGGGAFVSAVGGAVCLANPIAGGIVLFLGIGSLIAGASVWGVYQNKINAANKTIRENQGKINDKNSTLVALNILSGACNSAVENSKIAVMNLNSFASSWVTFGETLKAALQALKSADESTQETGIEVLLNMRIASKNWDEAKDYAKQLLAAPADVKTVNASEAYKEAVA